MKLAEIKTKTDKELDKLVEESRAKLSQVVIDMRTKQISNVKEIASIKRTIARILTTKRQRELNPDGENNA